MKVVVIGGVAAGLSCASKLRRLDKEIEITVYEKGKNISYAACGLPYYISNNMDEKKLIAREVKDFKIKDIEVNMQKEVVNINTVKKELLIKDVKTDKIFTDYYDKLFIGTGASPVKLNIREKESKNVFTLKTIEDAKKIKDFAVIDHIKEVAIIGGGYIGVEVAESMVNLGKTVKIIEYADQILNTFDVKIADFALEELKRKGVEIKTGEKVLEFKSDNNLVNRIKTSKNTYMTDMVLMCVGVKPNTEFLKNTNMEIDNRGRIVVDRYMNTSVKDIYAAGDCAVVYHKVLKENTYIPLGTTANKMGRLAAGNILGQKNKFIGTLGSAAIKIFDWEFAKTGISEEDAIRLNINYKTNFIETYTNPKYYPHSSKLYIKILYDKNTKKILGAQAAGTKDAVLRIDIFAGAIHNGMTTEQLGMMDLCYSPPFSNVWDAVNIAGNAAK